MTGEQRVEGQARQDAERCLRIAAETEGYLGSEGWISKDGKTKSAVYYWSDLKHLRDFAQHMTHREAKASPRDGSRRTRSSSPRSVRCTATAVSPT